VRGTTQKPAGPVIGDGAAGMVDRVRARDWASTPLVPPQGWPQSLQVRGVDLRLLTEPSGRPHGP
jgi:hypothetical protein